MTKLPSPSPSPSGRRRLSRPVRLAVIAGVAAGTSFAAATGVSAAASTGGSNTSSGSGTSAAAPAPGPRGHGPRGGPHGPGGGGPGGGGTITAINGGTLTLRTENGSETVTTSSSTTYRKEMQTITFSALHVGDVVHVVAAPATSSSASAPPQPGTGSVTATAITVVEPSFAGRVMSISGGTYTLVGHDGQLLTVTTSGSTRYYDGTSPSSASVISVGSHVVAEGSQSDLTHLSADLVALRAAPGSRPAPGAPTATAPSSAS